ncbi:MAG: ABC transporter permease [Chloroflexota bacterium]|nr:ABC transporter permease [Chloroflexota bacterium]
MQRYIVVRLFHAFLALFAMSIIVFSLARISGNPMDVLLPEDATVQDFEIMTERWGLDKPLHMQYLVYVGNVLRGDFGTSIKWPGRSTRDLILARLPATLELSFLALVVAALLALPLGVMVAVKKDTGIDYAGKVVALLGQAAPSFWVGIVLIWIFAVTLEWLPASGRGGLTSLILPAFALGWFQVAAVMRLTRSSMLEVLDSEYVKLARIKGIPNWKVVWKHCLRNAAIAPLTYFGFILGGFLTGSVVIETVFAWPGVGLLAIDALRARDFQVVQSVVLFFGVIYIASNLLVDILYAYLDPRIRYTS